MTHKEEATRKTRWVPYVGETPEDRRFAYEKLSKPPEDFKMPEHPCRVCGGFAPFGVGFPANSRWFCALHIGDEMPDIAEQKDRERFEDIRRMCIRGATLWLNLMQAADNQSVNSVKGLWSSIRDTSIEVSDILKALGVEKQRAAEEKVREAAAAAREAGHV